MRKALMMLPMVALIAACHSNKAPTGQVAATVNGQEITVNELNAELAGTRAANPQQQHQLQVAALQSIVNRVLLAQAAERAGVNDSPNAAIAKRRAEQMAEIGLLEQQIRSQVPQVSREEADQFVNENPGMFAQRKIFLVEQITVPSPPPALLAALRPLNTMTEVQAELAKYNLPTRTSFGVIDAVTMNPDAVRQISALAPDSVFILPDRGAIRINRVRETQVQPITGTDATNVATEMLRSQRIDQQVSQAVQRALTEGQSHVQYNPQFRPPQRPAAPAGQAAGAAAPGAAAGADEEK